MGADNELWHERDWARVAIGAALVMLVYFTVINHVGVYPLNNLPEAGSQVPSTLAGWVQFTIFIGLVAIRRVLAVFTSLVISVVWLVLQLVQWWIPYLTGRGDHGWYLQNGYDETWKVLPAIGEHVVTPDLQHNVLQLLSLVVVATAILTFRQVMVHRRTAHPQPRSPVPSP